MAVVCRFLLFLLDVGQLGRTLGVARKHQKPGRDHQRDKHETARSQDAARADHVGFFYFPRELEVIDKVVLNVN